MRAPAWLLPTLKSLVWHAVAWPLFALIVWRQWPLDSLIDDGGTLVWALFGVVCVVGPDEVGEYFSLRGQGYSSYTGREARAITDIDVIRVAGVVILLDAWLGVGQWLIWTWW